MTERRHSSPLDGSSVLLPDLTHHGTGRFRQIWVLFAVPVLALVVMWYLQQTMKREAASWDAKGAASPRGLKLVSAACLLWAAVLIGGRLTAYLGSLYL